MTNIAGIFDSKTEASRAIFELVDAGFKPENIKLVATGDTHHRHMMAIIAGACVGAAAGSLSGALVSAGFAADAARSYTKAIKQGKVVVIVYGANARIAKVRIALCNSDATIKTA